MAYQKINWANGEAGNTPLNANNLNKMDDALDDFEGRIGDNEYQIDTLETTVAGHTTAISGKMDKNNPVGSGTLEIPKIKVGEVVAYDSDVILPYVTKYTDSNGSSNKIADKIANIDSSILSIADTDRVQNFKILMLQDQKLGNLGEQTLNGSLTIPSFITEQYETELNGYSIEAPTANFKLDISVLTDSDDAVVNVGSVINTMKSDIQELKDNVGFEITSASPLNGCSASSIVGIDACGNSTQSGTPTPTNPIPIVDASEDVTAIGKNLFDKERCVNGYLDENGNVVSNAQYRVSDYIEVGHSKITISGNKGGNEVICFFAEDKTRVSFFAMGSNNIKTLDVPQNAKYVRCTVSADNINVYQVEIGATATSYVPYASNTITLDGNILDVKKADLGKAWNYTSNANRAIIEINAEPSKTYTVDLTSVVNSNISNVLVVQKTGRVSTLIEGKTVGVEIGESTNITTDATCKVLCLQIDTTSACTSADVAAFKVAKILDPNAILKINLRSLDTVADELIVYPDKTGKIIKRAEKYNFADIADLGWALSEAYPGGAYLNNNPLGIELTAVIYCTHLTYTENISNYQYGTCYLGSNGALSVWLKDGAWDNLEAFKDYLRTTKGAFYIQLATPTETPLTPEEVASIRQLQTYSGTTIIDSALDVKSVTYHAGVKEYIDWRFEQLINTISEASTTSISDADTED